MELRNLPWWRCETSRNEQIENELSWHQVSGILALYRVNTVFIGRSIHALVTPDVGECGLYIKFKDAGFTQPWSKVVEGTNITLYYTLLQ